MLIRLQRLNPAIFACAFLCLAAMPLRAYTRRAMPRPVAHPRVLALAGKKRHTEPVHASRTNHRAERVSTRRDNRVSKQARGHRLAQVNAPAPRRRARVRERVRERNIEPAKMATVARTKTIVDTPDEEDPALRARELYLAHQSASEPVGVVSLIRLIRPTADRPQLPEPEDVAAVPQILPSLSDGRGRLVVPAALRGSHEILVHQNEMADRDGLTRVRDDDDLFEMRRRAMLVALPVSGGMQVDERLPADRRFCRPWTANFLAVLARAHFARFHTALQVNSAVRTVAIQQRLLRTNGNAAPIAGETASPHLTGQAVDIAKRGLSLPEIAWLRGYLLPLIETGKIDVEEEFQQSCFHISVYKRYAGAVPEEIAVTHRDRPAALAIMLH